MNLSMILGLAARSVVGGLPPRFLTPSAQWNGTAGSGFGTANPVAPTDPTRTTAKPVLRLLTPDFDAYTDEHLVGVFAAANDSGSLFTNLGMEKVIFHYEGNTAEVVAPTYQTFDDANGNPVSYLGWWIKLKHNGTNGGANLYIEGVARDATMQRRVIGPFRYNPRATLYDVELEIAATPTEVTGVRYKTLKAAFEWLRGQSFTAPRLTVTEAGNYSFSRALFGSPAPLGWITVEASAPVVFNSSDGDTLGMWGNVNQWHFKGSNITFDFATVRALHHNLTQSNNDKRYYWLDGVNLTVSSGRYSLVNGNETPVRFANPAWYTECTFTNSAGFGPAQLARGCSFNTSWRDIFNNVLCVIGCTVNDADSTEYSTPINALTVSYGGAEATATIAISGANNTNGRVVTVKYGANTATWTVNNNSVGGGFYSVADLAAWINTLPGFTATVLDDTRRAASLSRTGVGSFGAFGDTDVKTAPLTLITAFDVHSDFYQMLNNVPADNIVIWGNTGQNTVDVQLFLFQPTGVGSRDVICGNNAFSAEEGQPFATQFSQSLSHFMFVHNSISEQNMLLRADLSLGLDSYSLIANNVAEAMDWSGSPLSGSVIKDNHLYTGATSPANSTGTTIGGTTASLFANAVLGNFAPQGGLLSNLKTSRLSRDLLKEQRAASAAAGAVA